MKSLVKRLYKHNNNSLTAFVPLSPPYDNLKIDEEIFKRTQELKMPETINNFKDNGETNVDDRDSTIWEIDGV